MNIELVKEEGKTLGFSIAGGRGSTPAYEDVDEVLCDIIVRLMYFHFLFVCVFHATPPEHLCD